MDLPGVEASFEAERLRQRSLTPPSGRRPARYRAAMPGWGELQVDQLRYMAREHGPAVAYRNLDAGTSITFAEWDAESNRLARGLVELGVAKGERVSIYL